MKREGDTLIFEAGEDIVCGDLYLSNKGGYRVELVISDENEVGSIFVFRGGDSLSLDLNDWQELGLSLEDEDVFSTYDGMFDWRVVSLDTWKPVG